MTVLVLGATGRIGRVLQQCWAGRDVVWQGRRDMTCCDILGDPTGLARLHEGKSAVLCLAGVTPGPDRDLGLNAVLARAVLDAARAAGAGPVLLMSSAAVYGAADHCHAETDEPQPNSDYGRAKREMENVAAAHPHGSTSLRLGNLAGSDAILGGWKPGMQLDTLADGRTPRRSYIGPQKLASILWALLESELPDVLNLAAPGVVEMGDLLNAAGLEWGARPATDTTIPKVAMSTERLESFVTFAPEDSTAEGIVADWRGLSRA